MITHLINKNAVRFIAMQLKNGIDGNHIFDLTKIKIQA